jgi:nucleotide-binding universal stress UspA family protein
MTRVLVWVTATSWEACVDAAAALDGEVTLLHVSDTAGLEPGPGLLGRHRQAEWPEPDPDDLLEAAAERLGRPAERVARTGQAEHEVIEAAAEADVLVVGRTGRRPGPHSFGHATRFVVDHAPCAVLLVWPE